MPDRCEICKGGGASPAGPFENAAVICPRCQTRMKKLLVLKRGGFWIVGEQKLRGILIISRLKDQPSAFRAAQWTKHLLRTGKLILPRPDMGTPANTNPNEWLI